MSFEQIAWLPLCAGVTGVGLVLSFLVMRRRGAAAGLRAAAWSLLPIAAFLTNALPTLWQIGTAVVTFVANLVLNPTVWAGVGVAGLSALLFLVSGFLRGRKLRAASSASAASVASAPASGGQHRAVPSAAPAAPGATAVTQPLPKRTPAPSPVSRAAAGARPAAKPAGDDDFSDIEDILKRRGIG
ncbi:cellulose synthase [Streptosporangium sp. NPDC002721]|uniref:cellulose synthase n=1 Tax=Streptosporangium sp. NPDC002721 TaxID=3366188 RepID=UPI0036BCCF2A